MKLSTSKSKNSISFYVTKSIHKKDGKYTSKVIEKLGTYEQILEKSKGEDPYVWAKKYIDQLNRLEKEAQQEVRVKYSPTKQLPKDKQQSVLGGYLFLQKLYQQLGLSDICKTIQKKYKFTFPLDSILSKLLYSRILFPASKSATHQICMRFIEPPDFSLHQIYRALGILHKEMSFIQAQVYKNSMQLCKRNTGIIYYDCTNYFFEIEQESGSKQYGQSKQHQPLPLVQMGLFMDSDGIPLAFQIWEGNKNEQLTLQPLEEKILSDFALSRFVVCTDAGLASEANRRFNDRGQRAFITTQSIKKLKKHLKEWALDEKGWKKFNTMNAPNRKEEFYDLSELDEKEEKHSVFYKERWINENDFEQKLIVTFSIKYRDYHREIRRRQIERAQKLIDSNPDRIKKHRATDYKRLIRKIDTTKDGVVATENFYCLDHRVIEQEALFDGFYGTCTNLDDDAHEICKINHWRWEIEECFRIMKSEFKARPCHLQLDDRIAAHFLTCFLSLILYRFLEKKLGEKYTCCEILQALRDMNFALIEGDGYVPTYTRTDLTDDLHAAFDFHTDFEIIKNKKMMEILKFTHS